MLCFELCLRQGLNTQHVLQLQEEKKQKEAGKREKEDDEDANSLNSQSKGTRTANHTHCPCHLCCSEQHILFFSDFVLVVDVRAICEPVLESMILPERTNVTVLFQP